VPAMVLVFLALGSIGLPFVFGHWQTARVYLLGNEWAIPAMAMLDEPFGILWSRDFQLFSVLCAISPALAALKLGMVRKLNVIKLLFLSTVPYLALMIVSWRGILGYAFKRRILWPPTGQQVEWPDQKSLELKGMGKHPTIAKSNDWQNPLVWEATAGVLFGLASLTSLNLSLFAVSCSLLIGVGIHVRGWESKLVRLAAAVCFALIFLQMLISLLLPVQSLGMVPLIFSVHF
jgi:hypothetical protein